MARVVVWPANDDASAWYRLKFPAFALAAQGADVTVGQGTDAGPRALWDRRWPGKTPPPDARVIGLHERPDADVVVINRPARAHWCEVIPLLQAAGVRVVVDVDDDFSAIPAGNSARATYDERRNPRCNRQWIARACEMADLVTCSTRALAGRYGRHGRVAVLTNLVPQWYLDVEASDPVERSIGWSGSVETHPGDLESTGGALGDVLAAHDGWSAHVVGTGKGVAQKLGVQAVSSTRGWLPFAAYPLQMARITVGIVPLLGSRFNEAKSCLKAAEFAALGVPVVMSPTDDNKRLHGLGIGLLASSPSEWRKQLTRLVEDEDFRADLARRGREAMRTQTYEENADRWLDAWTSTVSRRNAA